LIVTTPEHALAAIATDLPPHAAHLASSTADDLLIHEDQLWIPVEATLAGKTFAAAWEAGAREIARWKKTPGALGIVDLRAAWTKFPPIAATSSAAPGLETLESLGSIVGGELEQLEARRRRGFEQELSRLGAGEATEIEIARGRLLAYAGREREARAIFEALAAKPDAAAAGHNNLGNLSLAAGDPESARKHYSAALAVAREKTRVRMNLAIVALALGDEKGFAEQVHACLEAGDEDAVLVLSRLGMGPAEATRGAGAAQPPVPLATHLYWL
jgi:tetratricopeptide (TPR) repeat protein